jgi:hypothetical protein
MRFDRQEFISGLPSVVGIPTELLLPISENGNQLSISTFSICRLNYEAKDEDTILLETSRPTIYSLQLLTDDLALHHTFLCSSQYLVPNPPHYKAKTRTPAKSAPVVLEDGFIVPDEFSQRSRKVAESGLPVLQKVKYAPSLTENKKLTGRGRTVENEIVIRKISRAMAQENQQEIIDIANELQSLVLDEDAQGIGEPSKTLFEHAQSSRPEVGELAEASEVLQDLLSLSRPGPVPDEPGLAVKQLMVPAWASAMDIPSQELNFERIYTHIIDHQLAPLANEIPSRLRLAREKLARTIAAELILSNSRLELVDSPEESQEQEDEQGAQYSLPFHPQTSGKGKERATNAHPPSSQLSNILSSQPMPTPSHSASRAVSVMSRTSTSSLPSTAAQKILSRLSRHVSIDLSTTRSNWAARPMTLLSHWDIGVDPASYSYGAKLSEIEKQRQEESMTDKQRLKAREKAERRLRRQRKEVEKAERARFGVGSSQPVVMSSQRGSQYGGSQYGSQYGGISSEPLLSSPPPMMSQISVGSSQAPPVVGSSQNPGLGRTQSQGRREDGPSKRKKRKREGF